MKSLAFIIASGFYSGSVRYAPGTVGSITALIFWLLLKELGVLPDSTAELILVAITLIIGVLSSKVVLLSLSSAEKDALKGAKNKIDPQFIVIDEWLGLFIALIGTKPALLPLLSALAAFRLFDILKPGPVRWAEKLPGAWGIMLDDLVAGLFALALVRSLSVLIY